MTAEDGYPCRVRINGEVIDTWTSYELDADVLTPADAWRVRLHIDPVEMGGTLDGGTPIRRLREATARNARVEVAIEGPGGEVVQLTGILDTRHIQPRPGGSTIELTGRDVAAFLIDDAVPVDFQIDTETRFVEMARRLCEPHGLEVTTDTSEARSLLTGYTRGELRERARREAAVDRGTAREVYTREAAARSAAADATIGEGDYTSAPYERTTILEGDVAFLTENDLDAGGGSSPGLADFESLTTADALALGDPATVARLRARRRYAAGLAPRDVERLTVREARPRAGETRWAFLERHARRLGLLLWATPDGSIAIGSPNYGPARFAALRRLVSDPEEPNNVLEGDETQDGSSLFSKVIVYGRTGARDASRSPYRGAAANPSVPHQRVRIIHDGNVRSQDEADRRAKRELRLAAVRSDVVVYTMPGHGQSGLLYAPDTTIRVLDEVLDIDATRYVYRRTFRGGEQGTVTTLYTIPTGAIAL